MKSAQLVLIFLVCISTSACTDWIFRIDIPQGNFLDQDDVNQLRVNMSKEQVIFVLGNPVVEDSFDKNTWYYVYDMKRGMKKRGPDVRKELVINFENNKIASLGGDFEIPEDFDTPLEQ